MQAVHAALRRVRQTSLTVSHPALRLLVAFASLAAIALYLYVAFRRIRYPYELEWMEGGMVDHVARLLRGARIYVRPGLDFTPFVYPPFYYYVSAASASVFGLGFFSLRIVSLASSIGSLAFVTAIVRRETGSWTPAIAASGMLAASFPLSGGWFDIGRVDSLFVLLLLAALWIARRYDSAAGAVTAAIVFTVAFHTKQSALVLAASVALCIALTSVRRALLFSGVLAAAVTVSSVIFDRMHGGWFSFYTVAVVRGHALAHEMHAIFWRDEILRPCAAGLVLSLCFALVPSSSMRRNTRPFFSIAIAALLLTSWLSRIHSGGWLNVLIPGHVGVALGAGLGLHVLLEAGDGLIARRWSWIGAWMMVVQLGSLAYDPATFIPRPSDKAAGDRFLSVLRGFSGDVLLTHHGYLPSLVRKPTFAHHMAVIDVMRSTADIAGAKAGLRREFEDALQAHRFSTIVIDNRDAPFLGAIEQGYQMRGRWSYVPADGFFPPTGAHIRPDQVFVPR